MKSLAITFCAILLSGCSGMTITFTTAEREINAADVAYQTRRVPVVTIENRTSCHLEALVENGNKGVIVKPHSVMTIYITNLPRNPSTIRVWLIAVRAVPGMSQCHLHGEIEQRFSVPASAGTPVPLWVVKEDSFR